MKNILLALLITLSLYSCKKSTLEPTEILFLGNNSVISTDGKFGMSASSGDKDLVNITASYLKLKTTAVNVSIWENDPSSYKLSSLDKYLRSKPTVIVIRLGENVKDVVVFEDFLRKLMSHIKSKSKNSEIVTTGCFQSYPGTDKILQNVTTEFGGRYVPISHLYNTQSVTLDGYPNDIGMNQIAWALIYELVKIQSLVK